MHLRPRRSAGLGSAFSSELYQKAGSEENAVKFAKIGLLSMQVVSLEKEISDLADRIEESRKHVSELPCDIERSEKLLTDMIADQKILESLESRK